MRYRPPLSWIEWYLVALVLLALVLPCAGQQVNATLTGTIKDSSGAVVPQAAVTVKNVSFNEPFFNGHFPGRPVMPGVLIIEALAQSAALFALGGREEGARGLFMLTGLDKVRFRRQVIPGDQLRMEVRLVRHHPPLWKIRGEAHVAGELAAEAEISAMLVGERQ